MLNSLIGLAQSFGQELINPAPDAQSNIAQGSKDEETSTDELLLQHHRSHEIVSTKLLETDENALLQSRSFPGIDHNLSQEIVLTITGENDDDCSTYNRTFKVDHADPEKCKAVIAQEIACALSDDSVATPGKARLLKAEVVRSGRTPSELRISKSISKSKSWGSKSTKPNVHTVDDEEDAYSVHTMSTMSMSVRREPRNDLTVDIDKPESGIRASFLACASVSAMLCETMMICPGSQIDP